MRALIFALSVACTVLAAESSFEADIAAVTESQPAVVKLHTNDGKKEWVATAFFVSPTKLLTAAHTFKNTDKKGFSNHFILRGGKFERVTILKIDYKLDICLLLAKPNSSRLVLSEKIDPVVTIRGFPAADKSQSDIEGKSGLFEEKVEINKPARWGMSGGPVLNKDGTVCGMLVWKDFLNTYSKAISSKTLLRFLK